MERPYRPRIVTIGVNYETDALALRFVRDVTAAAHGTSTRIVLVDNSERQADGRLFELVHADNPDVLCVRPPQNLGYFGGASFGFSAFLRTEQGYDWVIVSNVDVEFDSPGFFAQLGRMGHIEDVGVVAPSIMSKLSHHDQNPFMVERPSRARMEFYRLLYRSYYLLNAYELLAAIYRRARHTVQQRLLGSKQGITKPWMGAQAPPSSAFENHGMLPIYAPHGACVVFSKRFFSDGGSLDLPVFLFGEEICIAETVRSLGLRVLYNPKLVLTHHEHQSPQWRGILLSRKAASHLESSTSHLVDTYFR
jgi:GT2 family glycosyltransferase